jgi:hypothetical protein
VGEHGGLRTSALMPPPKQRVGCSSPSRGTPRGAPRDPRQIETGRPAWTSDGSEPASYGDRQVAGWLKVATSRPNASMWSLIEKATTAPRVVAGRPRLGTSSANTDNL